MSTEHLVLAGGGHAHSLVLRRWLMYPHLRPKGLITLISRKSRTLYSGMVPGLIAGYYKIDDLCIDLRSLAERAGVALVIAEISGLDTQNNSICLNDRPSIEFDQLSLDVGAETKYPKEFYTSTSKDSIIRIKPFCKALEWIQAQDQEYFLRNKIPLTVVGSGFAAVEVVLSLRIRWPDRKLYLQADSSKLNPFFRPLLYKANISLISYLSPISGPTLLCTGSKAPRWIEHSTLPVDSSGRVLTTQTLQVIHHPKLFAVGDCGAIKNHYRPASGVWAVRVAMPLARNLERCSKKLRPLEWRPQKRALQLIGVSQINSKDSLAWMVWGDLVIGPHHWLWRWKQAIDKSFMKKFELSEMDQLSNSTSEGMACRGCAAKFPAYPLREALAKSDLSDLAQYPEDAALISSIQGSENILQSVDGFPALISDPWLNGRLTALHASSDIWAMGASVSSAQVVITLPKVSIQVQKELLAQSLSGINSALEEQGAKLVGGHTVEARSPSPDPCTLGIQIALSLNGFLSGPPTPLLKGGLHVGDEILISRAIGSGVLFAAARIGKCPQRYLDNALEELGKSQHSLLPKLFKRENQKNSARTIHACTDITGFGLLGHLDEMLSSSNFQRNEEGKSLLRINLFADLIPSFQGVLSLFAAGYSSTLAPHNRKALQLLERNSNSEAAIELSLGSQIRSGSREHLAILELLVDPQTCGPLLVACPSDFARDLIVDGPWQKIGTVE